MHELQLDAPRRSFARVGGRRRPRAWESTRSLCRFAGVLAALSACAPPAADAHAPDPAARALPRDATKTVEAFVGKWTFSGTFTESGHAPVSTREEIECTVTALGRAVYCRDVSPDGTFEESQLIAYDHVERRVRVILVNSHGEVSDHRCAWTDEHTLACEPLTLGEGSLRLVHTVTITADGNRSTFHELGEGERGFVFHAEGHRVGR
jgi:hypothetical protein